MLMPSLNVCTHYLACASNVLYLRSFIVIILLSFRFNRQNVCFERVIVIFFTRDHRFFHFFSFEVKAIRLLLKFNFLKI